MSSISRRNFVALMSAAAAGTAVGPLGLLNARRAMAQIDPSCTPGSFRAAGFGPISAKLPLNSAELPHPYNNVPLLSLPDHFQYTAISLRGMEMSDGVMVPGNHDGMACFPGTQGKHILVRNHERGIGGGLDSMAPNGKQYDRFTDASGGGGTTTVIVDRSGRVVKDYISLGGTIRNCAGGPTYWGSWISCEENVTTPTTDRRATKRHGYNFEVPSQLGEAVDPIPLVAMGRLNHEAVSVDARSGYIYETEDRNDSVYYRFVPKQRPNGFGDIQRGGDLYAMVIELNQRSNCNGALLPTRILQFKEVVDTRGLRGGATASMLPFLGQPLKVEWVKLEDVDPVEDTLRFEAQAKGAAVWFRGEGAWFHQGKHYWVCSNAGDAGEGQVWCYDPQTEAVTLVVECTDENLLDGPDNMTVARDGTIYLCEDGTAGVPGAPNYSQRIVGIDASGGLFDFAKNIIPNNTSEFAGACFSSNGKYLFVNSQGAGISYAIWRTDERPIYLNGSTQA